MRTIKVLGSGCSCCIATYNLIEAVAQDTGSMIALKKIEDIQEIMTYDVISSPAEVIDEVVVHRGGVPSRRLVSSLIS